MHNLDKWNLSQPQSQKTEDWINIDCIVTKMMLLKFCRTLQKYNSIVWLNLPPPLSSVDININANDYESHPSHFFKKHQYTLNIFSYIATYIYMYN